MQVRHWVFGTLHSSAKFEFACSHQAEITCIDSGHLECQAKPLSLTYRVRVRNAYHNSQWLSTTMFRNSAQSSRKAEYTNYGGKRNPLQNTEENWLHHLQAEGLTIDVSRTIQNDMQLCFSQANIKAQKLLTSQKSLHFSARLLSAHHLAQWYMQICWRSTPGWLPCSGSQTSRRKMWRRVGPLVQDAWKNSTTGRHCSSVNSVDVEWHFKVSCMTSVTSFQTVARNNYWA